MDQLDPLCLALFYFRINRIEDAHKECSKLLEKNSLDQAAWSLKLSCFAEEVYVDELENEETGLADTFMDLGTAVATAARPGTSLYRPLTGAAGGPSPAVRPRTASGRPLSGMQRPESRLKTGSMEQMLRTSRTSKTARPVSASTARQARLGTASMLSKSENAFINLARLNVAKYARDKTVNRSLFDHVFLHEADMRTSQQIATIAQRNSLDEEHDWFWPNQLGKCYYRMGMIRDAENQFLLSLQRCPMVETDIGDTERSLLYYKLLLRQDASNVEGIACLGAHIFYEGRPEIALKFYRRILQMGVNSAELYANLALCCFYCQQFDLACGCLERAHSIADQSVQADLWYNTAHIAMVNYKRHVILLNYLSNDQAHCDLKMAERCFRLALATDVNHAESLVNLGILKMQENKTTEALNLFQSATQKGPHLYEGHYNYALLLYEAIHFRKLIFN
uniref:TPR_REGION domain-containing protein n=1 Tax=Meloidogyne hapla TaxID=6305 RepID=A0A1I8BRH5_MELHA